MELIVTVLVLAANWMIFQKMGRKGWEAIVPLYNGFALFEELYGNGWKMLLLLIPFYDIYLVFKVCIDVAHRFHKSTGFGVGLVFIYPVFGAILAFSDAVYGDGTKAQKGDDPVSETINSAKEFVSNTVSGKKKDPEALNKLEQLKRMHDDGILSDEEYEKMRKDLMDRI